MVGYHSSLKCEMYYFSVVVCSRVEPEVWRVLSAKILTTVIHMYLIQGPKKYTTLNVVHTLGLKIIS